MTTSLQGRGLVRSMLAVLLVGILIITTLWILRPFFSSIIWATMVVVATWPIMLRIERGLWGKRSLSVILMTGSFFLLFIVPFTFFIVVILEGTDQLILWTKSFSNLSMPPPPDWFERISIVEDRLTGPWVSFSSIQAQGLAERIAPYLREILGPPRD